MYLFKYNKIKRNLYSIEDCGKMKKKIKIFSTIVKKKINDKELKKIIDCLIFVNACCNYDISIYF